MTKHGMVDDSNGLEVYKRMIARVVTLSLSSHLTKAKVVYTTLDEQLVAKYICVPCTCFWTLLLFFGGLMDGY